MAMRGMCLIILKVRPRVNLTPCPLSTLTGGAGGPVACTQAVRGVGEAEVVAPRLEPFGHREGIPFPDLGDVGHAEGFDVRLEGQERGARLLDEVGGRRAAREGFEAEGPAAGEEVEDA